MAEFDAEGRNGKSNDITTPKHEQEQLEETELFYANICLEKDSVFRSPECELNSSGAFSRESCFSSKISTYNSYRPSLASKTYDLNNGIAHLETGNNVETKTSLYAILVKENGDDKEEAVAQSPAVTAPKKEITKQSNKKAFKTKPADGGTIINKEIIPRRKNLPLEFQKSSFTATCLVCGVTVNTSIKLKVGSLNWVAAGFVCAMGCFLGCCLVPFCVDSLKDVEHRCPTCRSVIVLYRHN